MNHKLTKYLINKSSRLLADSYSWHKRSLTPLAFCLLSMSIAPLISTGTVAQGIKVTFEPPAEDMPKTSMGGASRTSSQCFAEDSTLPFSALLPASSQGLTATSHPTILAYLPETSASKMFFSWRDEENQDHYQAILPIENSGAIVNFTLPESTPDLEVGKSYQWAIGVMCGDRLQPDSPMIQGQVKRVELTSEIQNSLDEELSLENAAVYGKNGLWYDTVATMAQLKTVQPSDRDLTSNWEELLDSVNLTEIAEAPLKIEQSNDR